MNNNNANHSKSKKKQGYIVSCAQYSEGYGVDSTVLTNLHSIYNNTKIHRVES